MVNIPFSSIIYGVSNILLVISFTALKALLVHQCGHGGSHMHRAARRHTGRETLTASWGNGHDFRKPPNGGLREDKMQPTNPNAVM